MDDDDIAIAATCLLWSCTSHSNHKHIGPIQKEKRQHSPWIRIYLQNRHHYSVYTTLLTDLADYH